MIDKNPAYRLWNGPHGSPAFAEVKPEHFDEAFEAAFAERRKEIEALANDPAKPSFDNTFLALERLGRAVERVAALFFHLVGTIGDDALETIERDIAPKLAREANALFLNPKIFARIEALWTAITRWCMSIITVASAIRTWKRSRVRRICSMKF